MLKKTLLSGLLLILPLSAQGRTLSPSEDPLTRIQADYRAGTLSIDEWAVLVATAAHRPDSLPAAYAVSTQGEEPVVAPGRGTTIALLEVWRNWNQLSPQTQQSLAQLLARPAGSFTYDTPGGFFKIHWDTTGTHAVPSADGNGNGRPDYIDKCAAYLDSTIVKQSAAGYLMPPSDGSSGGDSRYDVYFESMFDYGYTQGESLGTAPWNDATSFLVLNKSFLGFPANSDPEGDQFGAMKATIAHEFHHAIQFGYDYSELLWYMELDATWTEDVICPLTHDNYNYVNSFFSFPASSLMESPGYHMYASYIWAKYLEQRFSPTLLRAVWEGARYGASVYTTLSDTLAGRYGWTQDSAFAEFASWNFATGSRNDGSHHTDAANYPLISIGRTHSSYPATLQTSPNSPAGYAASYVQFIPQFVSGTLTITFDGADSAQWAAYLIKSTATNVHQFQKLVLTPGTYTASVSVPVFQAYTSVTLVGINTKEFSGSSSFQYSASLSSAYNLSAKILTDTMVYSGGTRQFRFQVNNNAPSGDVARISASDTQGWVNVAPFDQFIAAGDSQVVNIPVTPPVGTSLGTQTMLTFKATSKNDTTKFDIKSKGATTVLQIGDVDFDGGIDISDLTGLIGYLYLGGPPPIPIAGAGNFDCQGSLDIGDLSELIAYLYLGGPPCACRAF